MKPTKQRPIKTAGYSYAIEISKLMMRRTEAVLRQEKHDLLSTEQKIAKARKRRGKSSREIKRLSEKL